MRDRSDIPEEILKDIKSRTLVLGINSDYLFPLQEQIFLAEHIPNCQFETIDSDYGHDGFLIEYEKISRILDQFLSQ
jgi:homoserine O-acetyltransferase